MLENMENNMLMIWTNNNAATSDATTVPTDTIPTPVCNGVRLFFIDLMN